MSVVATIAIVALQFGSFGLVLVPWELSFQSLAGLCLGTKTSLVMSTWLPESVLGFF